MGLCDTECDKRGKFNTDECVDHAYYDDFVLKLYLSTKSYFIQCLKI